MTERTDKDELGTCKSDIKDTATYYQIRDNIIQVNNKIHSYHIRASKPVTKQQNIKFKNKYTQR
jgi:hypothetical protein